MSTEFKFAYYENDVYIITEKERPNLTLSTLPWSIYEDTVKVATGYIRWSDEKQSSGHSLSIQERAIIIKAQSQGYQAVVIFVEAANSAFHNSAIKRPKMKEMKEYILSNKNTDAVIFYEESRVSRRIEDFPLEYLVPIREKNLILKFSPPKRMENGMKMIL